MEYAIVKEENRHQERDDGLLFTYEEIWVRHFHFLASRGYQLRPRYNPDWVPSWRLKPVKYGSGKNEDAIPAWPKVVDAICLTNGQRVMLKHVELSSEELSIMTYVNTPAALEDSRNHCVRLMDVILLPACETHALVVTPLLYEHSALPFRYVGELVEISIQIIECLDFLHDHNIVHRDFCKFNVMVDGERLIPGGWHPFDPRAPPDGRHDKLSRFKWVDRRSTGPHAYYLIDFGYSKRLESRDGALLTGIYGQDDSVPEMSLTVPYDPYPVDVYHVGNMLLKFYGEYRPCGSLERLKEVAQKMAHKDPSSRYTAQEASKEIHRVCRKIGYFRRRQRIWPDDPIFDTFFRFLVRIGVINPL
ncbi:hypothetical protein FA13DRAFT_318648 [Coprinellus micaceus]|uniref:Protein kinase domain-containing protein n=1 Tax=Coprinellus micaceus TaxID=71717 RepID=A0A4Y7TAM4_COPMI|nr:hypothetical protein FA13DRAFT_473740 [Coprinellus micaceus]TEB31998.1 hypothetical protein FA13DRAFT_318648 [Coprinellus micaceus]